MLGADCTDAIFIPGESAHTGYRSMAPYAATHPFAVSCCCGWKRRL
jgi:hypothetical protein